MVRGARPSLPPEIRILNVLRRKYGTLDPAICWVWPGATCGTAPHLYGAIKTGSRTAGTRRNRMTHIVMWEAANGPTPTGLELDHFACQVKLCCNPSHLEAVTHQVNMDRKPAELVEKQVVAMLAGRGISR